MSQRARPGGSIPQADPGAFYRLHREQTLAAMARVIDSGRYILGDEVQTFESEFARFHDVDGLTQGAMAGESVGRSHGRPAAAPHAAGVASGTDAIALALRAIGVTAGDRVATVSHTAVATVAAIRQLGARPLLLDVSPRYFTLDAEHLAAALAVTTSPVKAVVVVHLYGQAADMSAIVQVAARHGAAVIEDCAQAHGATWQGRPVGGLGAAGAFSFYPTKNLGALGDGGMVITTDANLAARIRMLREYGWQQRYVSAAEGVNSRLDELQAAVLRLRLQHLAADNHRRMAIAAAYDRGLAHAGLQLPATRPGASHVYHQYVVRHPERDRLRAGLAEQGIATNIHYPVPVHLQPAYADICDTPGGGLPHTEAAARDVLSLPMFPELDDASVERVTDALRGLL